MIAKKTKVRSAPRKATKAFTEAYVKELKETLKWYARDHFPKRPPQTNCVTCRGTGEYTYTNGHNGNDVETSCDCVVDPAGYLVRHEYSWDKGAKARAVLAKRKS